MLDPLVYGEKAREFDMPIRVSGRKAVMPQAAIDLPPPEVDARYAHEATVEQPNAPFMPPPVDAPHAPLVPSPVDVPHARAPSVAPPEIDAQDKHEAEEFTEILQRVQQNQQKHEALRKQNQEARQQRRDARRKKKSDPATAGLASEPYAMHIAQLCKDAKDANMPCICLMCPQSLQDDVVHEWNHLCRLAARARMVHRTEPLPNLPVAVRMLVINREGRVMLVSDDWMRYFVKSGMLFSMYVMSLFDQRHILPCINDLPIAGRVLVYDPESARCLQYMQRWTCNNSSFVMHLDNTPFPAACVVERRDEMLCINNI